MNEIKRFLIVIGVMIGLLGLIICIHIFDKPSKKVNTTSTDKYELYYIGREGCGFCQKFNPNIEYIKETYGIDYTYINTDEITSTELGEYLTKFNVNTSKFGTPTIAITKNGEPIDNNIGYLTKQELYNFLKKNNVITEKYKEKDYPNLTYIDKDDYKEITKSNEKQLVVISQEDCEDCEKTQKYLNKLASEQNVKVNYYMVLFETQDEYNEFYNSYEYIKSALDAENLYTPTFMVVENKKVVDALARFESEEAVTSFLKKNGIIK